MSFSTLAVFNFFVGCIRVWGLRCLKFVEQSLVVKDYFVIQMIIMSLLIQLNQLITKKWTKKKMDIKVVDMKKVFR